MRVAFIVSSFPSISETFILDEITSLLRRGHDVDIYSQHRGKASDVHPAYIEYGLRERTSYGFSLGESSRVGKLLSIGSAFLSMLRRNPKALLICLTARRRGLHSLGFVVLASAMMRRGRKYDVVHSHFGPSGIRADVLRRAGIFDAPIVTTFHGYDVTSFVRKNGASAYKHLAQAGERFIAVSDSIARILPSIGIPQNRTVLKPLGVDCSLFIPPKDMTRNDGEIRVLSIGRLVEKKGFEYGIRAIAEARKRGAMLRYDIVGDGGLLPELQETVSRLELEDYVTFHGRRTQTQILAHLKDAHVVLVPSVTSRSGDQESMPIVLKEAMAMGLPVVASRHAGIPEIVTDGETGLLAPERSVESLAGHLVALAGDNEYRLRLGHAGRSVVENHFNNEKLVSELVELYATVQ